MGLVVANHRHGLALCGACRIGYAARVSGGDHDPGDSRRIFAVLWAVFFFQGMTPGFWVPSITNMLTEMGLAWWVTLVFLVPPLCALVSPLIGGALADQRVSANRLLVWSSLAGTVALGAAFWSLDAGWHPGWFLGFLAVNSIVSGPSWGLLATVSLTHLHHGESRYPLVRVGATFGWVAGGLVTSYILKADTSITAGYAALVSKFAGALLAFGLPHTPPMGQVARNWSERLGFGAFRLLRQRDQAVFFAVTAVFSIPLTALYMYSPEFLRVLGDPRPTGTMTIAQASEVVAMLALGAMMTRFRVKTMLLWALGLCALRYGMSAVAGMNGVIAWHVTGIAFHGVCYTFYFITAQVFLDRRVEPEMKGQAQGLLGMVSNGLGPLLGALLCGWLRHTVVKPDGSGWDVFWGLLGVVIAVCFAVFALCYRGRLAAGNERGGSSEPTV
jgi:MFS family permease